MTVIIHVLLISLLAFFPIASARPQVPFTPSTPTLTPSSEPTSAPSQGNAAVSPPVPTITPTGPIYHLRTCLQPGQDNKTEYEGLFLWSYHTGAGLGDAVAAADSSFAKTAFLNGSYQVWDFGTPFPWALELAKPDPYTEWANVQINAGLGGQGIFELDDQKGLIVDPALAAGSVASQWGGWRVCDWNHGVTQLFWVFRTELGNEQLKIPESCADVNLVPDYLA